MCSETILSCSDSRGSVVGWCTMLQDWRPRVPSPMRSLDLFSIYIILPVALWPSDGLSHSATNKTEYQKSSWG
jgi:hypothetical protein